VTSETDPNGNTTEYVFDLFGRVTLIRDALLGETVYSYDFLGYLR
jgi:YD repeat-containing protein